MSHLIFSYILTGVIFGAINDIWLIPEHIRKIPEDECLGTFKYRFILAIMIIFGWLPIGIWILYQALTYSGDE